MRRIGHVIGARATVATRRSVIRSADGFELVFVFCGSASSVWSAQKPAPNTPAADCRNERLPPLLISGPPPSRQCGLQHRARVAYVERERCVCTPARVLRLEALPLPVVVDA